MKEDLMDAFKEPYCKLCNHDFTLGESYVDHFIRYHQTICYEFTHFMKFVDIVGDFIGQRKGDKK